MLGEEREKFEQQLDNDSDFKTLVEDIQSFLFGIETQALKEQLDDFHKELPLQMPMEKKTKKFKAQQYRFMKFAAAAVLIIAVGCFWFLNNAEERLFDNYYTPDPGLPTTMSSSDNFEFFDAMVNYKQKDYDKAIRKWEVLHKKAPQNDTINYFLGSAYLAHKKEDTAITYLKAVVASKNSAFQEEAYYYLGLAYLKKEDIMSAKKNFSLSTMDKAQQIRSKLD